MVSAQTMSVVERAKQIYAQQLRSALEANHRGHFVAIEPESGEYFVAETLDAAVRAARLKYPDRLTHTVRVGYPAAIHVGGVLS